MRALRALLLALLGAAALVLLSEGVLSLALQRGWRELLAPAPPELALEREQAVAARATAGQFRVPEDPLVGYTLKLESTLSWGDKLPSVQSDELGLRARATPPPAGADAEGALRIVVLGDSVAFGYGLAAEDVLAAQLERALAAALPGRAVVCDTVAVPSWNCRNAWRFLFDHLERFRPSIVVYLPVDNDLEDGFGVTETGQRRSSPDLAAPEPLLSVHSNWPSLRLRMGTRTVRGDLGVEVLSAGMTATSRERFADMARTIGAGADRLARAGAKLALAFYEQSDFERELLAELARAGRTLPEIPLLAELRSGDTLGFDPHPSAATTSAFAGWVARTLFELGWLAPDGRGALAPIEEGFADRRATALAPEEALAWSQRRHAELEDELEPRIRPSTLQGMLQIYGGLNGEDTLGLRFAAALRRGRTLRVRLAPLAARPHLYPLEVRVRVNGRELGALVVLPGEPSEGSYALAPADAAAAFEVELEPRDWAVVGPPGRAWVAAARLEELESLP